MNIKKDTINQWLSILIRFQLCHTIDTLRSKIEASLAWPPCELQQIENGSCSNNRRPCNNRQSVKIYIKNNLTDASHDLEQNIWNATSRKILIYKALGCLNYITFPWNHRFHGSLASQFKISARRYFHNLHYIAYVYMWSVDK